MAGDEFLGQAVEFIQSYARPDVLAQKDERLGHQPPRIPHLRDLSGRFEDDTILLAFAFSQHEGSLAAGLRLR